MELTAQKTIWNDGSGIALEISARLEYDLIVWMSDGELWRYDDIGDMGALNAYRIVTEFDFSDRCELLGEYCGPDDPEECAFFSLHEVAHSLTYCGHGLKDVPYGRLGELLAQHPLERVFEIIEVDLNQFRS